MRDHLGRHYALAFLTLALVQLIAGLPVLFRGTEYLATTLTIDDTYYYLQTAWNHRTAGFPTFDGVNPTNGFQFLWHLVLYLLAHVITSKDTFLTLAVGLCFLFNSLSYVFIRQIGEDLKRPRFALVLGVLWFALSLPPFFNGNGMETSVHFFCFWWALFETLRFLQRLNTGAQPSPVRLVLPLVLTTWGRVDSVVICVLLYVSCLTAAVLASPNRKEFLRGRWVPWVASLLLGGLGLAVQLAANHGWGDTLIPISGLAKTSNLFPDPEFSLVTRAARALRNSYPWLVPSLADPAGATRLLFALVMLGVSLRQLRKNTGYGDMKSLFQAEILLLAGSVLFMAAVVLSPVRFFNARYFSPVKIFWIFSFALAIDFACEVLRGRRARGILPYAPLLLCLFAVFAGGIRYITQTTAPLAPHSLDYIRHHAALWVRDNVPEDYVLAAWNAGQFGYFSNHRVINLDGVVNSREYFERVSTGREPVCRYLHEQGVRYVMDHMDLTHDRFTKNLPVVRSFGPCDKWPPEANTIHVWDLGPEGEHCVGGYYRHTRARW